jgi:phage terminase small subunit
MTTTRLTPKRENFAREYVALGCAAKAYRAAFDASAMAPETVRKRASELLADGAVKGLVTAIRAELAQRHGVTLDKLLIELESTRLSAMAGDRPQCAAAVSAVMAKARLLGFDRPGIDIDLEAKRLTVARLRLELDAMEGKDKATASGQDRPAEYVLAPDEPVPDCPIL